MTKVAIVPGNGGGDVEISIWYSYVRDSLVNDSRITSVALRNMPDPIFARETLWIPFMRTELECDEKTVIIGYSSGAAAAMRFAEQYRVKGLVLVGAYSSDLGDETERESGYFSRPWLWDQIRQNAQFIIQFGSVDDPCLPWPEQKLVADALHADLRQFSDRGHFVDNEFPEVIDAVKLNI